MGSRCKRRPNGLVSRKPRSRRYIPMCAASVAFGALAIGVAALTACVGQQRPYSSGRAVEDALGSGLTVAASAQLKSENRDLLLTRARITNEGSDVARFAVGGCPLALRVYRNGSGGGSLIWRSDAAADTPSGRERGCPDIRNLIEIEPGGVRDLDAEFRVSDILAGVTQAADYRLMIIVRTTDPRLLTPEVPAGVIRLP